MNLFSNIESIISACDSYDKLIKRAEDETAKDQATMFGAMMGAVNLADSNARRFLDQFGQFDAYVGGDIYAVLPKETLENDVISKSNFSVLSTFKDSTGKSSAIIKFAPGTKFPIVLVRTQKTNKDVEDIKNFRKKEEILFHLTPLILALNKEGKPLVSFLRNTTVRKTPEQMAREEAYSKEGKPITPSLFDSARMKLKPGVFRLLREYISKNHVSKDNDADVMVSLENGETISKAELRHHIQALYNLLVENTQSDQQDEKLRYAPFDTLIANVYELYANKEYYKQLGDELEQKFGDNIPLTNFDPNDSKETNELFNLMKEAIQEGGEENRLDLSSKEEVKKYLAHLSLSEDLTPTQTKILQWYRKMGKDKFYEKLVKIEEGIYNIPPVQARYIERAFINIPDRSGKKLAQKIRDQVLASNKGKNAIQLGDKIKAALASAVQKQITDLSERPTSYMGDITFESFGQNKDLFPGQAELPIAFPVDEYFSDPETAKEFSEVIPNEASYMRVPRQSAIIEREISKLKSSIDKNKILELTSLRDSISIDDYQTVSQFDVDAFSDKARANKFKKYLNEEYDGVIPEEDQIEVPSSIPNLDNMEMPATSESNVPNLGEASSNVLEPATQFTPTALEKFEKPEYTYDEFKQNKRLILIGIVNKEIAAAKNIDKIMKLLELRKIIDPVSPMYWISNIYYDVEKALKITALSSYLHSSLLHPMRLKKIEVENLPEEMKIRLLQMNWDEKEDKEDFVEGIDRPEKVYPHEITQDKPKEEVEKNPPPSFYLMDRKHYELLRSMTNVIGEKYASVLKSAGNNLNAANRNSKFNSYTDSQIISAYVIVTSYFNFQFQLEGYKDYLRVDYLRKIDNAKVKIDEVNKILDETAVNDFVSDMNRFETVTPSKIYHDHIIVPADIKFWIDVLLACQDASEPIAKPRSSEEIQAYNDRVTEIETEYERIKETLGEEDANKYKENALIGLKFLPSKEHWDSLPDLTLETEIAPDASDSYWKWFKELRETYTGFMSKLEKSGYKFNVSNQDPVAQDEVNSEEKHPGVVSGERGTGTFKLEKNRPNATYQVFPQQWEPLVTIYSVDDYGNPQVDDKGNKIVLGTYSLLDEEFWQTLMTMPEKSRKSILEEATKQTEEITLFAKTDDASDIAQALLDRANNEPTYEEWKKEEFERILNRRGADAADKFLEQEARFPSEGKHKRLHDINSISDGRIISTVSFSEVFDVSLTTYLAELNENSDDNPEITEIENQIKAIGNQIKKIEREVKKSNETFKYSPEKLEKALEQLVRDKEVQQGRKNTLAARLKEIKKANKSKPSSNNVLERYTNLAQARLPNAISNAIFRNLMSTCSIIKELIVDDSELRAYVLNKIKNFVSGWIEQNKNSEEYLEQVDKLLVCKEAATYSFSYEKIYNSFMDMYSNIHTDKDINKNEARTYKQEQLNEAKDELTKRRIIFYLMNTEERSKEGIDMNVYYDKDFTDTILQNVINETYKIDEMMRKFAKTYLDKIAESTYEHDPENVIVSITDAFLTEVRKGGSLYDEFRSYSVNAGQLVKDENTSYDKRDYYYLTPEDQTSNNIQGPFRSYVIERMTEFVDNYVEVNGDENAIVNSVEQWEGSFNTQKQKGIVQYIYDLVKEPFSVFEDMSKQYLMKEPKDEQSNITGRIALLLNAKSSGVVIETPLEKMLNLVVGEVHKLDSKVFEQYNDEMSVERGQHRNSDEVAAQGDIVSLDVNRIKSALKEKIFASNELNTLKRLISIMYETKSSTIDPNGYNKIDNHIDTPAAIENVITTFINERVDELVQTVRDGSEYVFDSGSSIIVDTIMELMPLREFARYNYTANEVKEMVVQCVDANSFKKYDYRNRNYYRISERKFRKNIELNRHRLDKMTEDKISIDVKNLVRSFTVLESSLIKCLTTTEKEFINNDGAIDKEHYPLWINKAYDLFTTAAPAAKKKSKQVEEEVVPSEDAINIDDVEVEGTFDLSSNSPLPDLQDKISKSDKIVRNSKEFNKLLKQLGINKDSNAIEEMKEFIKTNLIPKLLDRQTKRYQGAKRITVRPDDPNFINLIINILNSRYGKELENSGYTTDKLAGLIQSYMVDSVVNRSESTPEGAQLKGIVNELENPVDMSFSLVSYDNISTFGTRTSDFVVSLMEKKIPKEVWNIATTLSRSNITNLKDVKESNIEDPAMKEFILANYDNAGLARLCQLGQLIAGSSVYNASEENYYVKFKAYKKGDVKYSEVDGPLEKARMYDGKINWGRNKRHVPIIETIWKPEIFDVKDEAGNPVINPANGFTSKDVKLKGYLQDEDQLDAEVNNDKQSDFIYEVLDKWKESTVGLSTAVQGKDGLLTLEDFFGKGKFGDKDKPDDPKSFETGQYHSTVVSETNLNVLKELLRKAIYQDRVLDFVAADYDDEIRKQDREQSRKQTALHQWEQYHAFETQTDDSVSDEAIPEIHAPGVDQLNKVTPSQIADENMGDLTRAHKLERQFSIADLFHTDSTIDETFDEMPENDKSGPPEELVDIDSKDIVNLDEVQPQTNRKVPNKSKGKAPKQEPVIYESKAPKTSKESDLESLDPNAEVDVDNLTNNI